MQETETVFVDAPHAGSTSSGPSAAIKIGVGVAVPVTLLVIAGIGLLIWRKRRQSPGRSVGPLVEGRGSRERDETNKDEGFKPIIKTDKPQKREEVDGKEGIIVYGVHEVYGSYRSNAHELHGNYLMGVHELQGNHAHSELPGQSPAGNPAIERPVGRGHPRRG